MIILEPEKIQENFEELYSFIGDISDEVRKAKLTKLFDILSERFALSPASHCGFFHYAFPGGLVLHTLNVIKIGLKLLEIWKEFTPEMKFSCTREEFIFCALVHDLGKIGDLDHDYYIENDSDWHIKNRQEFYKINPEISNMGHEDRSIWLLNLFEIPLTKDEFIAIKCHTGLVDEGNKYYFQSFDETKLPRKNLIYILHWADYMSYRIELEQYWTNKEKFKNDMKHINVVKKDKVKENKEIDKLFENLFK